MIEERCPSCSNIFNVKVEIFDRAEQEQPQETEEQSDSPASPVQQLKDSIAFYKKRQEDWEKNAAGFPDAKFCAMMDAGDAVITQLESLQHTLPAISAYQIVVQRKGAKMNIENIEAVYESVKIKPSLFHFVCGVVQL